MDIGLMKCSNMNMDTKIAEDKKFYLQVWKKVLAELLGYTEMQADEWIKLNCKPWERYYVGYKHEKPEFWVTDALISPEAREKIGIKTARLKRDIVQAFEQGNFGWYSETYDWSAAHQRIKDLFAAYGVPDGYLGIDPKSNL